MKFSDVKRSFNVANKNVKVIDCFLPVHLQLSKKETNLYKKNGSFNEQYYKWQFLECLVKSGLCWSGSSFS